MYVLYNLLLGLLLLILSPFWIILLLSARKYRAGFLQKSGFLPDELIKVFKSVSSPPVWFHAVSVGECLAVVDLVKEFHSRNSQLNIVLTTVTYTGQEIAKKRLGDIATVFYFPYDLGFITNKVISLVNPRLVVIVETEIWPNFAYNLCRRNIPLLLINGRLSPKSFNNYKKFRFLITGVLKCFTQFLMQADIDAERIIAIGADKEKVRVAGNLKYDIKPKFTKVNIDELRQELYLSLNDKVLIAGSTHSGEEIILLNTYLKLKEKFSTLKLILVPRHPERYDEVIALLSSKDLKFGRRTLQNNLKDFSILLLDTMGELSGFYSIADIAFVGGSLIPRGGHNPLEAAVYSVPSIVGPHTFNFLDITNYMLEAGAAMQVSDESQLYSVMFDLLADQDVYGKARESCLNVFKANGGATETTLQVMLSLLS